MMSSLQYCVFALLLIFAVPSHASVCDDYPCSADSYATCSENNVIQFTCNGNSGTVTTGHLYEGQYADISHIPVGARDVEIHLTSDNADFDLQLYATGGYLWGSCISGYNCMFNSEGTGTYMGMSIYFSGDDVHTPVEEYITIPLVTAELYLYLLAYQSGSGSVTYSWSGIDNCDDDALGREQRTCTCEDDSEVYVEFLGCYDHCDIFNCESGNVRLVDSAATTLIDEKEGVLQLWADDEWRYVCDNSFDDVGAEVACNELGWWGGALSTNEAVISQSVDGDSFWDQVVCSGSEWSLADCSRSTATSSCTADQGVMVLCESFVMPMWVWYAVGGGAALCLCLCCAVAMCKLMCGGKGSL